MCVDKDVSPNLYSGQKMGITIHAAKLPGFDKPSERRSRNMAAIKSVNTKPELTVRRALHNLGFRFGLHSRILPGKPDLVLTRFKTAVFVHGCFWHGHDCTLGHTPRSNVEYWRAKIERNVSRDVRNTNALRQNGWEVKVIRECTLDTDTRRLVNYLCTLRTRSENN